MSCWPSKHSEESILYTWLSKRSLLEGAANNIVFGNLVLTPVSDSSLSFPQVLGLVYNLVEMKLFLSFFSFEKKKKKRYHILLLDVLLATVARECGVQLQTH